ncbi:DEAD/DEAH box helicase [Micromonospora sp. CPCC 205556]|uniref:DEAD/DEAH box helicase n=1 Tax=Micromonospora sp. CPCC 205556 TaxID=3122398 RepID=UPI002FF2B746
MALWQLLAERPGQHKRQLVTGLQRMGLLDVSTTDVNRLLYASQETFAHDGGTPRIWRLTDQAPHYRLTLSTTAAAPSPRCYVGKAPRAWQAEAFAEWQAGGRRGVVEAVTGTGKTTVGVLAAAAAVDAGEKVLVLVPGRELLDQWYEVLRRDLRVTRVGRFGDGHKDSFDDHPVLVAIVHSARRHQMLRPGSAGLLIADEVHRYGAKTFAMALEPEFGARLGLTATYAREDDGLQEFLEPYFGDVVMGCSYQRGLADEILAPFRVGFLGTELTPDEREQYDFYDERARALRGRLILDYGCPGEPFGEFMAHVNELSQGGHGNASATADARRYLHAFSKRRQLLADCGRKQEALASLAPVLAVANQGLVFGETTASAEEAAAVLCRNGVPALDFTSALRHKDRKHRLAAFKHGQVKVLTAPRVLDEGVDVPQAEVGVIMAGSRSKRQMIQRMGRVIRPKVDRRPATFFVLYAKGTSEDPAMGAHEDFREQLIGVAQDVRDFPVRTKLVDLLRWYREGRFMS